MASQASSRPIPWWWPAHGSLLDFRCTEQYAEDLEAAGMQDVKASGMHFSAFPPVKVVTGTK